jgi:hypothetical protein
MGHSMRERLDAVERRPLKCDTKRTSETFVRGGQLFESARERCGLSKEQAADHYGVSPSLLTRQTTNQDNQHLSFQRICEMPPAFRRELAIGMLTDVDGVEVETTVRVKLTA